MHFIKTQDFRTSFKPNLTCVFLFVGANSKNKNKNSLPWRTLYVHNIQKGDAIKAIMRFSGRITYLLMHVHTDYHIVGTRMYIVQKIKACFLSMYCTYLTLFLPNLVTWRSYMGWFRPWPVGIGLTTIVRKSDEKFYCAYLA